MNIALLLGEAYPEERGASVSVASRRPWRGPPFERRACASCRPQGGAAGGDELEPWLPGCRVLPGRVAGLPGCCRVFAGLPGCAGCRVCRVCCRVTAGCCRGLPGAARLRRCGGTSGRVLPRAGRVQRRGPRCSIFAMHTASGQLPRVARAARRAQGPRGGTFGKLDTVLSYHFVLFGDDSGPTRVERRARGSVVHFERPCGSSREQFRVSPSPCTPAPTRVHPCPGAALRRSAFSRRSVCLSSSSGCQSQWSHR